jgi:hypothetical protein
VRVTTQNVSYTYGEIFRIKPIADVHLGNTACDVRAFKSYLADSDGSTLFLGIGDLLDCVITNDIKRYRKSVDASESDSIVDEQIDKACDILDKYKNQIIGLGSGNHEDVIVKRCGTNPTARICKRLNVPFLGFSGLVRLMFREARYKGGRGRMVVLRYHHGWGGGSRTQGADLTKFSKDLAYWDADVFFYGHVHRKQTDTVPRLGLSGEQLISKPKILCICGTFLKTYTKGFDPTYSEVKGYPPVELGSVEVRIKPHRKWVKMESFLT